MTPPTGELTTSVVDRLDACVRSVIAGRRVILAGFPVAAAPDTVAQLRSLGAERCFVVAPMVGTGEPPDPAEADWYSLDIETPDEDAMALFRRFERAMADPPAELVAALDRFDPDHESLVLVAPYDVTRTVAGRPAYGARRPAWVELEDKTANDALFDRAGVARPPCEVVPAGDRRALAEASRRVDRGSGSVWSGDAREGFNGGGTLVRWVTDPDGDGAAEAAALLAGRCDRVRVAPFLDGLPCSIHGLVTTDGVAVFRPVEMVTLRTAPPGFRYAGCATFFDPPAPDREAMRAAARRVGALIRDEVRFGGSFGIDGVLTADGFLPTELNPRFGAGLSVIARAVPEFPLLPVHWATAAGADLPVRAAEIEDVLVTAADRARGGGGWVVATAHITETSEHPVVLDGGRCRAAADGEVPDGTVQLGPGAEGGFVRFIAEPERTTVGPSIGPRVCAVLAWADDRFGLGLGPLVPATPA
jgi:hypothetical protein